MTIHARGEPLGLPRADESPQARADGEALRDLAIGSGVVVVAGDPAPAAERHMRAYSARFGVM